MPPSDRPPDAQETAAAREAELARLDRVARREGAVLLADGAPGARQALAQTLRELGFRRVERAADGERAWRILAEKGCDLVLADWGLPRLDGPGLLERVRSHPGQRDLVFILVSGQPLDRRAMQAALESQDAYLAKPVSPEKLARRLELALQRRRTQALAGRLAALGRCEDAADVFLAAAANHPRQRWPYFGLGGLLASQGRLADAERCYARVLELDPQALAALVELGRVRESGGQAQAGRALYRQALAIDPRLLKAYDALADSLEKAGRADEALAVRRQAQAQAGGHAPPPARPPRPDRAAAPPEPPAPEAGEPAPDPPAAEELCRQGLALVAAGRLEEAAAAYGRGLELAPGSGRLWFNLAKLHLRQGRAERGRAELAAAVRLGLARRDWDLLVEAARLLDGLGRRSQAVVLLEKVLRLAPGQAEAAGLLRELTHPGGA
ncbi:MAG: response regulator [Thermodesulfobacteriota bacterium]